MKKFLLIFVTFFATHSSTSVAAERLVPSEYATIQAAINAARSGDTIRLAPGDYYEQAIVLNKRLSIIGDPGAVIHAHDAMKPVPWNENVAVFAFERANVTVSNLVFEGHRHGVSYPDFVGIIFRSSSGGLENCTIRGFRATFDTPVRAVNVNNALNNGIIEVSVTGCSFSDNKLSLLIFGSDSNPTPTTTRFLVDSNTFVGLGAEAPFRHFGLLVFQGAEGSIQGNTFTDHIFNESGGIIANDGRFSTRGYFLALRPLTFSGNTFSNNSSHMSLFTVNNSEITNNVFATTGEDPSGRVLFVSGTDIIVMDNNFADSPEGIWLSGSDDMNGEVPKGIATDLKLTRNWFRNVTTPIHAGQDCTFSEEETQTSDFKPAFLLSQKTTDGRLQFTIRSEHAQTLTIESSTNFQQWASEPGTPSSLPVAEYTHIPPAGQAHTFYRVRTDSNTQPEEDFQ